MWYCTTKTKNMITTAWVGGGRQEGRADRRAKRTLGHGSDLLAFYSQKGKKHQDDRKPSIYIYYCMHAFFSITFLKYHARHWVLVSLLSSLELTLFILSIYCIVTIWPLRTSWSMVLEVRDSLDNTYIYCILRKSESIYRLSNFSG